MFEHGGAEVPYKVPVVRMSAFHIAIRFSVTGVTLHLKDRQLSPLSS